jgi:uncharacterized protein (TIGR00251 family)
VDLDGPTAAASPACHDGLMRIDIRVRPGASRTVVGGSHAGALVVRVTAPAVDGRATQAALAALAEALGVRRFEIRLVTGATSRTKVVDVQGVDPQAVERLMEARN